MITGFDYLLKRIIDLVGGITGAMFLLLIILPVSLAIRLTSKGPVIYTQERVGQGGTLFTMYKFRSMREGTEELFSGEQKLINPVYKAPSDPRVTPIGRFLRRWSLDEVPQFWNVVMGDMSLVGPRPEEPDIVAQYSDYHRRRLAVKPGMTGPMQVSGRADLSLDERVELELAYIENYSLIKDLQLLVQTIPAVLTGKGAR
jgi:lipopolysaccharide/colanic/teichoic acid biosynthesis glycosyltransferase